MPFTISDTIIQSAGSLLNISYPGGGGSTTVNYTIGLTALLDRQTGPLTANDPDSDSLLELGETLDHDSPLLGPPDLTGATVLGIGEMSPVTAGLFAPTPVIIVETSPGGPQYIIYTDPPSDLITAVTNAVGGTVNTQITLYPQATVETDGTVNIPCFTTGTLIDTPDGPRPVESLKPGDLVLTADHGAQPLRWIGQRRMDASILVAMPQLRPVRIRAGALGAGVPSADLLVSPQHRMLVRSRIAQKMFGTNEVLVAAKQLLQIDGVDLASDVETVDYVHLLFDRHEVVTANGAPSESLHTGVEAVYAIGPEALEEVCAIFPELRAPDYAPVAARCLASGRQARKLAVRHAQNSKPLFA